MHGTPALHSDPILQSWTPLQLVWQLSEDLDDQQVLPQLLPFLHDHSDDVRWAVLELLEQAGKLLPSVDPRVQAALPEMASLLVEGGASARIVRRCAEVLVNLGWALPPPLPTLPASLGVGFHLDKKGILRRP